jgi:hypothetical protein
MTTILAVSLELPKLSPVRTAQPDDATKPARSLSIWNDHCSATRGLVLGACLGGDEPPGAAAARSVRNHLGAVLKTLTPLCNRVRAGLRCPQPLTVEPTAHPIESLALAPGTGVVAWWKATATRPVPR